MRHPLTDNYRQSRDRLLELGRQLSPEQAATESAACPAWTIKDIFSHLAGISADILSGNTAEAATEPWADAQVAGRVDRSLTEVLAEWTETGPEISKIMESAGNAFPFQLFVDQWTHEWDIRAALGSSAAIRADNTVFETYFDEFATIMADEASSAGLDRLTLDVDGRRRDIGDGDELGGLELSMFEFARISMGRRSADQLGALSWPMADPSAHIDVLVRWSVATSDVIDPVT